MAARVSFSDMLSGTAPVGMNRIGSEASTIPNGGVQPLPYLMDSGHPVLNLLDAQLGNRLLVLIINQPSNSNCISGCWQMSFSTS